MKETADGSKIFVGHRALGFVSNHIPLVTRYINRRKEHLIVTSVGRVFHTYGGAKLGLLSVSNIHPEEITCISADSFLVFCAAGKDIYAWRRGTELKHIYSGHANIVHLMMPFGPHLISIDSKSVLKIWDIKSEKMVVELEFPHKTFEISSIVHPATYVNKILLGSKQGSLQLWNIKSCEKIYKFKGWKSPVLCLEQAPAIDVVAVGLQSGDIYVHNIKFDETIVKFSQDWGPVTCLSFRTDGQPVLVSASQSGHLALWDLEARKLAVQMREAHAAEVTGARCLPGEPMMVTSSPDNTLKQWIFDLPDGGGRLLRIKEGHAAAPTRIRFYGGLGHNILSAGEDSSLRSFSTVTDLLNKSFGIASYNRKLSKKHKQLSNPVKMEPIIDFTTEVTRDRDWDNIACVHRDTTTVSTWSFGNQRMGTLQLRHKRFKEDHTLINTKATCLCLTFCGNYVLIGYESGHVDKYNIQSGIHRGQYQANKGREEAHPGRKIRGICTDGLNQLTITGDNKGGLKFWHFSTGETLSRMILDSEILQMELHRDSSLLAVALQDFSLVVIDVISRKIVRKFAGHDNQISDLTFSADSRWVVSASLDGAVKVWDVPSGQLVDHFKFPTPVTSLTMSPRGDFLATAHVGDLGLYLWTNVTLYSHVSLKPLPSDHQPREIKMPLTSRSCIDGSNKDDLEADVMKMEIDDSDEFASPEQISSDLITLANLPNSRWLNLLKLDVIKARNKPKDAVQKPKDAPFFLPTVSGLETRFDLSKDNADKSNSDGGSRILTSRPIELTVFGRMLLSCESADDFLSAISALEEKGPSAVEVELISLSPEGGGNVELMVQFLNMVLEVIKKRKDFEAAQAYLALFMKLHADVIVEMSELSEVLERVGEMQEEVWEELKSKLCASATLVAFYKNSVIC